MFLSKYSLDRNNTIASLFRTPDFLIAEYYGLRNTIFWVTEDLACVYIFFILVELSNSMQKRFLKMFPQLMRNKCILKNLIKENN
jgi:hypothetical protein